MSCQNCDDDWTDRDTGAPADEYCRRAECQEARRAAEEAEFVSHCNYMRAQSAQEDPDVD